MFEYFFKKKKLRYLATQRYDVLYQVNVHNNTNENLPVFLILPLPQKSQNQHVISDITLNKAATFYRDEVYSNTYAVCHITLKPLTTEQINERYAIEIMPTNNAEIAIVKSNNSNDIDIAMQKCYLTSDSFINLSNKLLKNIINHLFLDNKVVNNAEKINDFVVKKLRYGRPIKGLYSSDRALKEKEVDCGGFSSLFVALCRTANIPARIVSGFWSGYDHNTMHAWAEFLSSNGQWICVDPSIEYLRKHWRTKKYGTFGSIGSDRIILSFGCDIPVRVNNNTVKVDIL